MIILSHQIKTLIRFGASKIQSSNILFHAKKLSIELTETKFFFFFSTWLDAYTLSESDGNLQRTQVKFFSFIPMINVAIY